MKRHTKKLDDLILPIVTALGFDYAGCEYTAIDHKSRLRVYIEGANGVTVDDCARVSRQISAVFDVESPIQGEYHLEVSSPGIERSLFTLAHFQRFMGQNVKVRTGQPLEGQRNFKGKLDSVDELNITLIDDKGTIIKLPFNDIDKANLVADFDMMGRKS